MKVVQHGSDRVGYACGAMLLAIALANPWAARSTSAADAPRTFRESAAEGGELRYVQ